ncbi:GGDEF domain-containing protein [soil metagenome]
MSGTDQPGIFDYDSGVVDDWDEETPITPIDSGEIRAVTARNRACMTVLTGSLAGGLFRLTPGATMIGRAADAEIRLTDDGISRNHARIHYDAETQRVWVEDLESRNGTFVHGERLTSKQELGDGDKLQVGSAVVMRFAYQDDLDESFHENLISSALRDPLTRLFNKRYFLERLDSELKFALRHDTAVSLLMVDLDHFKKVNDTHGHLAGDAVLVNLANVLQKAVRNEDVVARFGGEEMAIILRAIPLELAVQLADRLRKLVEETITMHGDIELRATASIGAAGYPATRCETTESLIEAADKALYKAKEHGRNRVARPTLR